jgi:hypothetical protein
MVYVGLMQLEQRHHVTKHKYEMAQGNEYRIVGFSRCGVRSSSYNIKDSLFSICLTVMGIQFFLQISKTDNVRLT